MAIFYHFKKYSQPIIVHCLLCSITFLKAVAISSETAILATPYKVVINVMDVRLWPASSFLQFWK